MILTSLLIIVFQVLAITAGPSSSTTSKLQIQLELFSFSHPHCIFFLESHGGNSTSTKKPTSTSSRDAVSSSSSKSLSVAQPSTKRVTITEKTVGTSMAVVGLTTVIPTTVLEASYAYDNTSSVVTTITATTAPPAYAVATVHYTENNISTSTLWLKNRVKIPPPTAV